MRLLIRNNDAIGKIYWVRRDNDKIVGWHDGGLSAAYFNLPTSSKIDLHFTYPKDGNYHFSLKYKQDDDHRFFYISAYKEEIKIKTICSLNNENKTKIVSRESFAPELSHLIPNFALPTFGDFKNTPIFHQLTVHSFQINNGWVKIGKSELIKNFIMPRNDDLIIETNRYKDAIVNVSTILVGKGNESNHPFKTGCFLKDDRDYPVIYLGYMTA